MSDMITLARLIVTAKKTQYTHVVESAYNRQYVTRSFAGFDEIVAELKNACNELAEMAKVDVARWVRDLVIIDYIISQMKGMFSKYAVGDVAHFHGHLDALEAFDNMVEKFFCETEALYKTLEADEKEWRDGTPLFADDLKLDVTGGDMLHMASSITDSDIESLYDTRSKTVYQSHHTKNTIIMEALSTYGKHVCSESNPGPSNIDLDLEQYTRVIDLISSLPSLVEDSYYGGLLPKMKDHYGALQRLRADYKNTGAMPLSDMKELACAFDRCAVELLHMAVEYYDAAFTSSAARTGQPIQIEVKAAPTHPAPHGFGDLTQETAVKQYAVQSVAAEFIATANILNLRAFLHEVTLPVVRYTAVLKEISDTPEVANLCAEDLKIRKDKFSETLSTLDHCCRQLQMQYGMTLAMSVPTLNLDSGVDSTQTNEADTDQPLVNKIVDLVKQIEDMASNTELFFQQTTSALQSISNAEETFKDFFEGLSTITRPIFSTKE